MFVHEEILKQIEALKGEIQERIVSIEDGTYYEDNYQEDRRRGSQYYDHYDDEFPDTLSEDQTDELESLFEKAAQLFLSGQLSEAREVYAALFRLLEDPYEEGGEADYSISDYALDVEMREARARYCRCVYETTPLSGESSIRSSPPPAGCTGNRRLVHDAAPYASLFAAGKHVQDNGRLERRNHPRILRKTMTGETII